MSSISFNYPSSRRPRKNAGPLFNAVMRGLVVFVFALLFADSVWAEDIPASKIAHIEGRVLLRDPKTRKLNPIEKDYPLAIGDIVLTGDASRFELRQSSEVCWRVGRRALFSLTNEGAKLLAGTALVQVPARLTQNVESRLSIVSLPPGTWIVQAVDNGGLKIVCLDVASGGDKVRALGERSSLIEPAEAEKDKAALVLALRPGDISFLQPHGRVFSPVVTVFLREVLATSRLVVGFPEELPGFRRIVNQAIAQQERLKGLSKAVVVGAPKAGGFQIAVPGAPNEKPAPTEPAQPTR